MKKIILVVLLVVFLVALLFSFDDVSSGEEKEAIKQAALDYIEVWYEGDAHSSYWFNLNQMI